MRAQQGDYAEAAAVLATHGAPPQPAAFELYRHVAAAQLGAPALRRSEQPEADCHEFLTALLAAPELSAWPAEAKVGLIDRDRAYIS